VALRLGVRAFSQFRAVAVIALATGLITESIACTSTVRLFRPALIAGKGRLHGELVNLAVFKDVRRVHQSAPDLCWAAALEQSLAQQGVDTNQDRLLTLAHVDTAPNVDHTLTPFMWQQNLEISEQTSTDGKAVWVRNDLDGGALGPILDEETFIRKVYFELDIGRAPIVCVSLQGGGGHCVTVVGAAFSRADPVLSEGGIKGFVVYDPLTTLPALVSTKELYDRFTTLVYVTTYTSMTGAALGKNATAYNH
jgi:hypothetical protein